MHSLEIEAERKLIVALDVPSAVEAYDVWQRLALPNAICKIGLELLFAGGVEIVRKLASAGVAVFVDAKLLDIPNTVERATSRVADLGAAYLTVHAQDRQTIDAAARGRGNSSLKLLGVTLLTSIGDSEFSEQSISLPADDLILRRAEFAVAGGFDGVISSPREASALKAQFGTRLAVVCPGIRPLLEEGLAGDDQVRTATPGEALRAGADYIVVGRPILRAADPARAARGVVTEMTEALREMKGS